MTEIPLQPIPSQIVKSVLEDQQCVINLYQKEQGLFFDLNFDGVVAASGVIARDVVPLVPQEYRGFSGNLLFVDTRGADDPYYSGLGDRWTLIHLTAEEYALL